MSTSVAPEGRALPDVVVRVSLHPGVAAAIEGRVTTLTEVQRRVLRHFRDRTATVVAAPPGTGRSTALALGVVSALRRAIDSGDAPPAFVWCACDEPIDTARRRLDDLWERSGGGVMPPLDLLHLDVLASGSKPLSARYVLVLDGLREAPVPAVVLLANGARAVLAAVAPMGELQLLSNDLLKATGGTFADCTEYARIRVRAWSPVRNDPFAPQETIDRGIVDELVRIAWSDGPVLVGCDDSSGPLVERAKDALTSSEPPPSVSGIRASSVRIERVYDLSDDARRGEVVFLGAPRSVRGLIGMIGARGGLTQEGARLTLIARQVDDIAVCAVARRALNRGELEYRGEAPGEAESALLSEGRETLLRELRIRAQSDDVRGERAALWLVSEFGINRGNAKALVALARAANETSRP